MNVDELIDVVVSTLSAIVVRPHQDREFDIYAEISKELDRAGIAYEREARLGTTRLRVDFLIEGFVGIEVKRGRPVPKTVSAQLRKYAETGVLGGIVLVSERAPSVGWDSGVQIPTARVSLASRWGVAVT